MAPPLYSLVMPSRGSLTKLEIMLDSLVKMTAEPDRLELVAYVDADDPRATQREAIIRSHMKRSTVLIGERVPMGTMTMECIRNASAEHVWLVNDDLVHETEGWDAVVAKAREDCGPYGRECCFFPDDSIIGPMMCCFPLFPRRDAYATDFFGCQQIRRYGIDAVIAELYGNYLRRLCYVPDWIVRHENLHEPSPETAKLLRPIDWCAFDHGGRTYFADPEAIAVDETLLSRLITEDVPKMVDQVRGALYIEPAVKQIINVHDFVLRITGGAVVSE